MGVYFYHLNYAAKSFGRDEEGTILTNLSY